MHKFWDIILFFSMFVFSLCGNLHTLYAETPGRTINDPQNDVIIKHIDVTQVKRSLNGEVLTCTFYLKNVPDQLAFNRTGVPHGGLEYGWKILIGIEFLLSANHWVHKDTMETNQIKPINEGFQVDVWKERARYAKASIKVDDQLNTITLEGKIPGIISNSDFFL